MQTNVITYQLLAAKKPIDFLTLLKNLLMQPLFIFLNGQADIKHIVDCILNKKTAKPQSLRFFTLLRLVIYLVPRRRFERPTCPLGGDCSIQLSYRG